MRITSFRDMDTTEDFEFVDEKMREYFRWGIADFYSLQQATYWIGDILRKEPSANFEVRARLSEGDDVDEYERIVLYEGDQCFDSWFLEEKASFMAPYSMVLFLNKDTNVAYAIEKNEFDDPGHVKYLCEIRK